MANTSNNAKNEKKRQVLKISSPEDLKELKARLREGHVPTIENLIDELKNQDEKLVRKIKRLLVKHGKNAIDIYIQALKTPNDQIYEHIVDVILELGEFSIQPLVQALNDPSEEIRRTAKSIVIQIGKTTVNPIVQALNDPSEEIRRTAKDILVQIGRPAVTPLINGLSDPSEEIRETAKDILIQIGRPGVESLIELLLVAVPETKIQIREILVAIGKPVVRPLMNTLKEPHIDTEEIKEILLEIGEAGVKTLIKGLRNPDPTIRENVEKLLLEIGGASTPLLLRSAQTEDKEVATLSRNIIRKMGITGIKPLIETIQTNKGRADRHAKLIETINLLGEISSSQETEDFLNSLDGESHVEKNERDIYQIIHQSINELIPLLQYDDDIEVKRSTIQALGKIGEPIVIDPLINLLDDPSWKIRADARDVVPRLKIRKAISEEEKKQLVLEKLPEFTQYPLIEQVLDKYIKGDIPSDKLIHELGRLIDMSGDEILRYFNGIFLDQNIVIEKLISLLQDPPKPAITITELKRKLILERIPDFNQFDSLEDVVQQYVSDNYSYTQMLYKLRDLLKLPENDFFLFLNHVFPEFLFLKENLILLLSKFEDDRIIDYLLKMTEDENPRIRWLATWGLRNHINEDVLHFFAERIKDPSYEKHVRWMSVVGLRKTEEPQTIDALIEGVKDSDEDIARWSSDTLAKIGRPVVAPLVKTLVEIADKGSIEKINVENVKKTLVKLRKHSIMPLIKQLDNADDELFDHIKDCLLEIGKPAIKPLVKTLNHPNADLVERVMKLLMSFEKSAVTKLIRGLGHKDEKIQINAMKVLYNFGEMAIPSLISALERKRKEIPRNAMKILFKMKDDSIPFLIDALEDSSTNLKRTLIKLLTEMSPQSIQPLIYALDETKEIAENAKIVLTKCGEKAIVKELLSAPNRKNFLTLHKILKGEKEFRDLAFRIKRLKERERRKKKEEGS